MRGRMREVRKSRSELRSPPEPREARSEHAESDADPWAVGEPMRAGVVGEVAESNHPDFSRDVVVEGESLVWAEDATADGDRLRRVDPSLAHF